MFAEIVKILADEPEKIEKAVLKAIKIILSILIAAALYKWAISPFHLIPLTDYSGLIDFILNGRVLICLFFYFSSEYLIIPILNSIAYLIIFLITKIKTKIDRKGFRQLLHVLDIVKYSKESDSPLPGRNIDIFYNFSSSFKENGIQDDVNALKNSVIENAWYTYFSFTVLFFLLLNPENYKTKFIVIIVAILLAILLTYWMLHHFFEYMLKNHDQLIVGLSFIKINNLINVTLANYGIHPRRGTDGLGKFKTFELNDKEYVLVVPKFYGWKISDIDIQQFLIKRQKPGRIFIVIVTSDDFTDNSSILLLNNHKNLILINYTDENNLEYQLKTTIENHKYKRDG